LSGGVDEVDRESAAGDAAGVGAVVVVGPEVVGQVAAEPAVAELAVAREGGPPALVEDRLVQVLDVSIGLRPAGTDPGVGGAELVDGGGEAAAVLVCRC